MRRVSRTGEKRKVRPKGKWASADGGGGGACEEGGVMVTRPASFAGCSSPNLEVSFTVSSRPALRLKDSLFGCVGGARGEQWSEQHARDERLATPTTLWPFSLNSKLDKVYRYGHLHVFFFLAIKTNKKN